MLLFENLDLTPLNSILWKDLHLEGAGRPVEYDPECVLRALMLRQLEQIPHVKDLVKRLRRNKEMRSACGYDDKVPTEAHFSQMKKRIGKIAEAKNLKRTQEVQAANFPAFQLCLREIQGRNLQELEKAAIKSTLARSKTII